MNPSAGQGNGWPVMILGPVFRLGDGTVDQDSLIRLAHALMRELEAG